MISTGELLVSQTVKTDCGYFHLYTVACSSQHRYMAYDFVEDAYDGSRSCWYEITLYTQDRCAYLDVLMNKGRFYLAAGPGHVTVFFRDYYLVSQFSCIFETIVLVPQPPCHFSVFFLLLPAWVT